MNNEGAQAIFIIVILLVALAIVLSPIIALWIYIFHQNRKRKRIRQKMLVTHRDMIGNRRWLLIRYASEPRFKSWFKIFPWEGAGILVAAEGSVLFLGETLSGAPVTLQFAPMNSSLRWLGKCPWPNGAVSWFQFDMATHKHYFSSETGVLIFGSHKSTKDIYEEVNRSFGGPSAQSW